MKSLHQVMQTSERFLILTVLILSLLIVGPILESFVAVSNLIDVFMTATVICMLYLITNRKRLLYFGGVLAGIMILTMWLDNFFEHDIFSTVSMICGILLTLVVTKNTLMLIIKTETVSREVVYAAMLLYILIAKMWAMVYMLLYLIDAAAFNLSGGLGNLLLFEYYSFVTLTTLGFGDITPLTNVAKMFSALEAVIGQLYLVVVIAWFVGMRVATKSKNSRK
ncbi:MAG: potassium channel family protein [Desulfobacterales bacterium]|nr:potassium channel family protein [Desulfobacterales bacterium]